jgi:hypothetical protein
MSGINPYSLEILSSLGLVVKQGQVVRLLDADGATFGRGETLCEAVLAAFGAHPAEAGEHAAALMLAVALDEDEDAVLEVVSRIQEADFDDEDEDEDEDEDLDEEAEDDEDEDEDEDVSGRTIRVRRE